tara:strand:- start:2392 stop:2556 length:165 start_codon:yes stop_codon:yes gene_type:complete
MLKGKHLSEPTKMYLAWQWCLTEEKAKRRDPDECKRIYKQYLKSIKNKNKNKNQ